MTQQTTHRILSRTRVWAGLWVQAMVGTGRHVFLEGYVLPHPLRLLEELIMFPNNLMHEVWVVRGL